MITWNPWHGCRKISAGCQNCYMYRMDTAYDRDPTIIKKTSNFDLPIKKKRDKSYKIPLNYEVFTCGTSDFFIEEADEWRKDAWAYIKARSDLHFLIITKRIDRFFVSLPDDWEDGYEHVAIGCTVENQDRADYRLPIFLDAPIKHRSIICEPILEKIDLEKYVDKHLIEQVLVGGESGNNARVCDYDWVLSIRSICVEKDVSFYFKQTGARFKKDGKIYRIPRKLQHEQARKSNLSF